jgi:FkbM family methyltransferase
MENYSQGQEQEYILKACEGIGGKDWIGEGKFLDIGAFHPEVFSNTRALFEKGWGGVMVEPGPEQMKSLLVEYGDVDRIALICAAVDAHFGIVPMQMTDDGTSTADPEIYKKWAEAAHYHGRMFVVTITIADILNQFGAFDFVSIDTEGTSVDVLRQLLNTEMRPKCICVEYDNRLEECGALAHGKGYVQTYLSGENAVYQLP